MRPRRRQPPLSTQGQHQLNLLAANVKRYRQALDMKQDTLGRAAGYANHSPISRLEHGRFLPSTRHLLAIADALGVTMADLWRPPDD